MTAYTVTNITDADIPAVVRKDRLPNPFADLARISADAHAKGEPGGKLFDIALPASDTRDAEVTKIMRLIGNAGRDAGISLNRRVDKTTKTAVTFRTWPSDKRVKLTKAEREAKAAEAAAAAEAVKA